MQIYHIPELKFRLLLIARSVLQVFGEENEELLQRICAREVLLAVNNRIEGTLTASN